MKRQEAENLLLAAKRAREQAYAPYSHFKVGAALSTEDGRTFVGVNVENASYGLSLCAERTAMATALAAGARNFAALAIVGDSEDPLVPCGACLQWVLEFAPNMWIVMGNLKGEMRISRGKDLLPLGFTQDYLGKQENDGGI